MKLKSKKPIAVACSDLHLSLRQPACRNEDDWLGVQKYYLDQLNTLARRFNIPVLCAGDIFDRWNPPPELIHFAMSNLPDGMIAIPGQHDLPYHSLDLMHKSGYGVLALSEKIKDISGRQYYHRMPGSKDLQITGVAWGQSVPSLAETGNCIGCLQILLIHQFCWIPEKGYPGAPAKSNLISIARNLSNYSTAIFGDNHKGFTAVVDREWGDMKLNCHVMNCGTFIRRKSDEKQYKPSIGLIFSDGTIKKHELITKDQFHPNIGPVEERAEKDFADFMGKLEKLGEQGLDFRQSVTHHVRTGKIPRVVIDIILSALEE